MHISRGRQCWHVPSLSGIASPMPVLPLSSFSFFCLSSCFSGKCEIVKRKIIINCPVTPETGSQAGRQAGRRAQQATGTTGQWATGPMYMPRTCCRFNLPAPGPRRRLCKLADSSLHGNVKNVHDRRVQAGYT